MFRSGDRRTKEVPLLLILKTTVLAYTPGSEMRRAVTTVTKMKVRIQLSTPEGHLVQEHVTESKVWFIGSNLRTTQTWHIAWRLR